jgi:hypothetical protein
MHAEADLPRRHRISVADYYRMAEVGILDHEARVELIEGDIIDMPPPGSPHAATVTYLTEVLGRAAGDRANVLVQNPVRLSDFSEPQPDVALLRRRDDFYRERHPRADDVLLLIEISATSLRFDRETKLPLYARHGITDFGSWILGAGDSRVTAHLSAVRTRSSTSPISARRSRCRRSRELPSICSACSAELRLRDRALPRRVLR